jgi:hypothetical protein
MVEVLVGQGREGRGGCQQMKDNSAADGHDNGSEHKAGCGNGSREGDINVDINMDMNDDDAAQCIEAVECG